MELVVCKTRLSKSSENTAAAGRCHTNEAKAEPFRSRFAGCLDEAGFRFRLNVLGRRMPIPMPRLSWQMCRHETNRLSQRHILRQLQREYGFGDPQHLLFLKCAAIESLSMVKGLGIRQGLQQHIDTLKKAARSGDSRLLE